MKLGRVIRTVSVLTFSMSLLLLLLFLRVWDPLPVETLRLRSFDMFQNMAPRLSGTYPVVIADIDEKSLAALGQWPWPRSVLAQLVAQLSRQGAKAIAFDILFSEPDRLSPDTLLSEFKHIPPGAREALARLPSNDRVMADAIERAAVVLGQAVSEKPLRDGASLPSPRASFAEIGGNPRQFLENYPSLVGSIAILEKAASGAGILSLGPENDNIVRRVPAIYQVAGGIYPSLALETLRVAGGDKTIGVRVNKAGIDGVVLGRTFIPTDSAGRIWIHFSPRDDRRYISVKEIVDGDVDPTLLKDQIVLVGSSAVGLRDIKATPVAKAMPGVEVQAQLLEMILSGWRISRPNFAIGVELCALLFGGIVVILLVPRIGAWWTLIYGACMSATMLGASWYLFRSHGILFDGAYPAVAMFLLYVTFVFMNYLHGEADRKQIREAFAHYLSQELIDRLSADPSQLRLGGEMREMTVLFTDFQGFTRISEQYDAVGLTNLVNRLFNPMTQSILDAEGTVDKYIGDSIMAFWNAPLNDPQHARNACIAALNIIRYLKPLDNTIREELEAAGRPYHPLKVGVGINTGECCVGNMGSRYRFNYSVIGDTVNIASRLEGQTRTYRVPIIVGETTCRLVPSFAFIELDRIIVLGKSIPLAVYALLGDEEVAQSAEFRALDAAHRGMLHAFRSQDWKTATVSIETCKRLGARFELDAFYDVLDHRIEDLRGRDLGRDWDAVYVATSKS